MLKISKCHGRDYNLVDSIMQTTYSDNRRVRMALTILYFQAEILKKVFDVDHMFPKENFNTVAKSAKLLGADSSTDFDLNWKDALPNLQLLTADDNKEKSSKEFKNGLLKNIPTKQRGKITGRKILYPM